MAPESSLHLQIYHRVYPWWTCRISNPTDAVKYDDIDDHEDWHALVALLASVPPEMASVLTRKPTVKLPWEAIALMRVDNDRPWQSIL